MNVFVLCTGRCGSKSFARACRHIEGFTAGHETRTAFTGDKRFAYPDYHIEVDNRLAWMLGRLNRHYGDRALYVHLLRNREDTIHSLLRRGNSGIVKRYMDKKGVLLGRTDGTLLEAVEDFYETVTENIRMFLEDKTRTMVFQIEKAARLFPLFCERLGARVDMEAVLAEFDRKHNRTNK